MIAAEKPQGDLFALLKEILNVKQKVFAVEIG